MATFIANCNDPNCMENHQHGIVQGRIVNFESEGQWYKFVMLPKVSDENFTKHALTYLFSKIKDTDSAQCTLPCNGVPIYLGLVKFCPQ